MYPHLFKTEDWLTSVITQIKVLNNLTGPTLKAMEIESISTFFDEESAAEYTVKCGLLAKDLNLYYDRTIINDLDNELKLGQFDSTKTPMLNRYVGLVANKFGELWRVGNKFTAFCNRLLHDPIFRLRVTYTVVDTEYTSLMPPKLTSYDLFRNRRIDQLRHTNPTGRSKPRDFDPKYYDLHQALSNIECFFFNVELSRKILSVQIGEIEYASSEIHDISRVLSKYNSQANEIDNKLNQSTGSEDANCSQSEPRFTWGGDKQELAELIWAICKSEKLIDGKTSRPATQKEAQLYFESIFNHPINVMGLLAGVKKSDKGQNGITFTGLLYDLVSNHINDEKKQHSTRKIRS